LNIQFHLISQGSEDLHQEVYVYHPTKSFTSNEFLALVTEATNSLKHIQQSGNQMNDITCYDIAQQLVNDEGFVFVQTNSHIHFEHTYNPNIVDESIFISTEHKHE